MTDPIKSAGGVLDYFDLYKSAKTRVFDLENKFSALVEVVKAYRETNRRHTYCVDCRIRSTGSSEPDPLSDNRCDLCKRADQLLKEVEG
jgi:hypothetical protein